MGRSFQMMSIHIHNSNGQAVRFPLAFQFEPLKPVGPA